MKNCITLVIFLISAQVVLAQQYRFVYLQTENKQPFYVKLNNVHYSSSATGYLIIPKLTDNTYNITIGFPKNEFAEQQVAVVVDGKDAGYVVKDFGEKGWGLFNLQTMAVVMATPTGKAASGKVAGNDDSFSGILADVVNTPGLATGNEAKSPEKQAEGVKPVAMEEPKPAKPAAPPPAPNPDIHLVLNNQDETGRQMVYIDATGGIPDTIRVFIPGAMEEKPVETGKKKKKRDNDKLPEIPPIAKEPVAAEMPAVPEPPALPSADKSGQGVAMVNSDCKNLAADKEYVKLRKSMAVKGSDEEMITAAVKGFKKHCFSTDQIRSLSILFSTDKGRYGFFDAAYPYVYDSINFPGLGSLLTDDYYKSRFDAMIRK